jgi:hypothetical protein
VTEVQPGALTVNVAAPVPEELAATVTGCGRFQSLDDSVMELPDDTDKPLLPEVLATLTVIGVVGDADSETPNTSLVPWATENDGGLAWRLTPEAQEPPPPVAVGEGEGEAVGEVLGDGDVVGDPVGELDGLGDGEGLPPPLPLQAVPLMLKAVGAVLLPL